MFQTTLQESVATAMLHSPDADKNKKAPSPMIETNVSNYVKISEQDEVELFSQIFQDQFSKLTEVLPNNVLQKINKISMRTFLSTSYPTLSQTVDNLTTIIIESAEELRALDVDMNLSKEKQKSQAKSIHQQKRKAIIDLFKALQKIGLSYQAGLVMYGDQINVPLEFTRSAPLSINNSLQNLRTR